MNTDAMTIFFPMLADSVIEGTELKWQKNGVEESKYFLNTKDNMILLNEFLVDENNIGEFQYRVHARPDKEAIDEFYSQWQTYRFQVQEEVIAALYDPSLWTFTTSYPNLVEGTNGPPTRLIDGDAESSFTINLQKVTLFDYIEWYHRGNDTHLGLRTWGIAIYGSNDGTTFTKIGNDIDIPGYDNSSIMKATLNMQESTYRYLKVKLIRWSTTANTAMQIGEFKLGYSKTATGKGIGIQL